MWCIGTRHCDSADNVFKSTVSFIGNWDASRLFLHAFSKPTALNHKAFDYSMKNSAFIETILAILQKKFFELTGALSIFSSISILPKLVVKMIILVVTVLVLIWG